MRARPKLTQMVLLICMLTFQLQIYAASTLSCRHAPEAAIYTISQGASEGVVERAPTHCPHLVPVLATADATTASGDSGDAADPSLGDCQKCMLDLCALGALGLLPQPPLMAEPVRSMPSPRQQPHFYRYSVDLWSKPPILVLS